MNRVLLTVVSLVVAIAVAVPLLEVVVAQGPPSDRGRDGARGPAAMDMEDRRAEREDAMWRSAEGREKREKGLASAEGHGLFGRLDFDESSGDVAGRWVRFRAGMDSGELNDYWTLAVNGTMFDDLVMTPGGSANASVHGAVFRVRGDEYRMQVHNNPLGMLKVGVANTTTIAIGLPATVTKAATFGGNAKHVRVDYEGGTHGHFLLAGNGSATIADDNRSLTFELPPMGALVVAGHPNEATFSPTFHDELVAIGDGTLGGTITVIDANGTSLESSESFGVDLTATEVSDGRIVVDATGDGPGRAVVMRLDPVSVAGNISVVVNGTKAVMSDDFAGVLATRSGDMPLASVKETPGAVVIATYIPHFSTQTIEVTSTSGSEVPDNGTPTTPTPTSGGTPEGIKEDTPGFTVVLALAAVVVATLVRRRRD